VMKELSAGEEFELLARLGELALGKDQRRLWKKTLHRLKSQGRQIPEPAAEPVQTVTFPSRVLHEWARATPVLALSGEQLLYYFASGTMGTNLLISQLNPNDGLQDLRVFQVAEAQALKVVSRIPVAKDLQLAALEIPKSHFLSIMAWAKPRTRESKFKMELEAFLERFRSSLPEPAEPGSEALELFDPGKIPAAGRTQIQALLSHIFFATWLLDAETVKGCAREMDEAQHSPIQLSEAQLADRMRGIVEKYSRSDLEKNWARAKYGLLENAWLLKLQGDGELAETAFALASSPEAETAADFFQELLLRSFPEAAKRLGKKPGGLLITGA